jgi:hypothetical protein
LPTLKGMDAPGRLLCVKGGQTEIDSRGAEASADPAQLEGFYGENQSFFDDIRNGRTPRDDLRSTRQSVIIAQCVQSRQETCCF